MTTLLATMAPIFGLLAIGFVAVKARWLDPVGVRGLVQFVFGIAIPALLLRSLARVELPQDTPWEVLVAYYSGTLATFGLAMASGRIAFDRPLREQAIFGMGAAYSNLVMMGIPVILMAIGPEATLPMLIILSFHAATLMPLTLALIQWDREDGLAPARQLAVVAREVLGNPIIIGILLGVGLNVSGLTPSGPLDRILELLEVSAVPCALFAMGASLASYPLGGDIEPAVALTGLKLIVHPLLVWTVAVPILQLDGLWVTVAVVLASMPTAVNAYLFGARYDAAPQVAARTVLITTVCSIVTIGVVLTLVS